MVGCFNQLASLRFYPSDPNELRFIVVTENSSGTRMTRWNYYTLSSWTGTWYHAVGTYNKTTGVQALYINGQSVSTASHTAGNTIVPLTSYSNMKIGNGVNTGYFDGKIDDVKIFNRSLSANEVAIAFSVNMDEGTGSDVNDSSAYGNDGTIIGASWTTGISGKALSFDGSNDYVSFGNSASVDLACSHSISAWIKLDDTGSYNVIAAKNLWGISLFVTNKKLCAYTKGDTISAFSVSNEDVAIGEWQHVATTFDVDGTKQNNLYINGEEVTYSQKRTLSDSPVNSSTSNFTIGAGGGYYFDGAIDEVKVYRKALSATEVDDLYDSY